MNLSISKTLLLIGGAILLIVGIFIGIDAMKTQNWVEGIFALVGIAVGCALILGRGITVSQ